MCRVHRQKTHLGGDDGASKDSSNPSLTRLSLSSSHKTYVKQIKSTGQQQKQNLQPWVHPSLAEIIVVEYISSNCIQFKLSYSLASHLYEETNYLSEFSRFESSEWFTSAGSFSTSDKSSR